MPQVIRLAYSPKLHGTVEVRVQLPNRSSPGHFDTRGVLNLPVPVARELERALALHHTDIKLLTTGRCEGTYPRQKAPKPHQLTVSEQIAERNAQLRRTLGFAPLPDDEDV